MIKVLSDQQPLCFLSVETVARCNCDWVVLAENTLDLISAACGNSGLSFLETKQKKDPEKTEAISVLK